MLFSPATKEKTIMKRHAYRTNTPVALVAAGIVVTVVLALTGHVAWAGDSSTSKSRTMKMTTPIPESIIMPDSLDTRIGKMTFFDGMPLRETSQRVLDYLNFHRGVDIFLDETRAASMVALRDGHHAVGVSKFNQVGIFESLMDSRSLWLTANTETVYASSFFDLGDVGPVVIESPPDVLGILDDMWMRYIGDIGRAGPDRGQGGKFLVLPPGYEGPVPEGYFVFHSRTYGVWMLMRGFLVDGDPRLAVKAFRKHLKIYPLSMVKNPPETEFVNLSGSYHNTVH